MQQTTHQYEFSSNTGHPGAPFHMTREFGSEPQQNTTYEYSRSVGLPGQPLEHAHSATNITKTYEFSGAPNFGGTSNQGTTTYEYTRTVGHPSQISYEFPKSSQAPERHSAYETRVYTQTYGGEQVVKSRPSPTKQQEPQSDTSSERDPDTIDFNHDELVDLMAEEHRHIRGTEPVIIAPITTNYTTDLKYSTADLLNFPTTGTTVTTYTVEKEKKSSAPVNVDVEVVGSTHHVEPIVTTTQYHHIQPVVTTQYHHGVEEWSKKKYLNSLADHEEEVEETRLDYCGLCVSKRRLKKSKY